MGRSLHPRRALDGGTPKDLAPKQLSQRVLKTIRDRILNWEYSPGQHLGERVLCDEFAASRIPVREALNVLVEQGLVERIPNQGCYVRQPDLRGVHQLYDLRLALELFAVEGLSRSGISDDLVEKVRAYWEPLLSLSAAENLSRDELIAADEAFHLGLAKALGNPYICDALLDLYERLRFVRLCVPTSAQRVQATAGEHLKILNAIVSKDVEGARQALLNNINEARNKVESALTRALAGSVWSRPTSDRWGGEASLSSAHPSL
jgi:DNA-binding GntR family transcriptional regulator